MRASIGRGARSSMSPTSSHRLRRATALLAVGWALSAILPSLGALRPSETGVDHPFADSRLGRVAVVQGLHPSAAAAGVEVGDRVVSLEGRPFFPIAQESGATLR